MRNRKMPDWMMDYVGAIGSDSFEDYRSLSSKYYNEISNYNENIYPERNLNYREGNKLLGKDRGNYDPTDDLSHIDSNYKEKALDIACEKYGYTKPDPTKAMHEEKLTKLQENSPIFSHYVVKTDKNLSFDDYMAKVAHKDYFKKNPEAEKNFEETRRMGRYDEELEMEAYNKPKQPTDVDKDAHQEIEPERAPDVSKLDPQQDSIEPDRDDI